MSEMDLVNDDTPLQDDPTPEDTPQCQGWGPKRGKCLNFAALGLGGGGLCCGCHRRKEAYFADDPQAREEAEDGEYRRWAAEQAIMGRTEEGPREEAEDAS